MDGSDGVQARRTASGSPLGELFDHGVDALATSLIAGLSMAATGYGLRHPLSVWALLSSQVAFYVSNLTLLHTGTQEFQDIDCQEVQVVVQVLLCVRWLAPSLIDHRITIPPMIAQGLHEYFGDVSGGGDPAAGVGGGDGSSFLYISSCILLPCLASMSWNIIRGVYLISRHYNRGAPHGGGREGEPRGEPWKEGGGKEGQGMNGLRSQATTIALHMSLSLAAYCQARSIAHSETRGETHGEGGYGGGSNVLLVYFIVSTYAFGDLMNHALVTRVGQMPFPSWFSNRGVWLLAGYYLSIAWGMHQVACLKWIVALAAFIVHTQYSAMMGFAIAGCLGVKIFKINYKGQSQPAAEKDLTTGLPSPV